MRSLLIIVVFSFISIAINAQVTYTVQPNDAGIDATVDQLNSTTNYSVSTSFKSERFQSTNWYSKRSYIYFDLSSIPANAVVVSASLELTGLNHSGANASYLRRAGTAWAENTITWANQPTNNITTDQISLPQSTSATQTYTVDVKTHVQSFIDQPYTNYGWVLQLQDETTNTARGLDFASSDYGTAGSRPKLTIIYEYPPVISGSVRHCTESGLNNGEIYLNVTDGVAPYTYAWSNGPTTKDITNLAPGLYTVTVTDANNVVSKKYFLVGCINTAVTVAIQPDGLAGKDAAALGYDSPKNYNYMNWENYTVLPAQRWTNGTWFKGRGYLQFDLSSLPTETEVTSATLTLYGVDHNTLQRTNASYLRRVTGNWNEYDLKWTNQPTNSTTDQISIAGSSTATQDYDLNVLSHIQDMITNPVVNYGWVFMLQDEATTQYTRMVFGSSDNANSAKYPKLILTFKVKNSYCTLKSYMDGGFYIAKNNELNFRFEDEYANKDHKLDVKIWDASHQDIYPLLIGYTNGLKSYIGDMRFSVNLRLTNYTPIASGMYLMEVTNEKNEKQYLKFIVP